MDLYEAMRCAPTSRRFEAEPVAREALVRVLDAARFAPSGGNRQGWRVVVVEDPARVRMVRRANEYAERLDEVPVHLVVGVRLEDLAVTDAALPRQSIVGGASVYPFVQNLLLGLRAEGLGAALTTLLLPAEADVRRLLAIPDDVALAAHIGVGHRAEKWPARLARRPVSEFAFAERFGAPLAGS